MDGSNMARLAKIDSKQANKERHLTGEILMLDKTFDAHGPGCIICCSGLPGRFGWPLSKKRNLLCSHYMSSPIH